MRRTNTMRTKVSKKAPAKKVKLKITPKAKPKKSTPRGRVMYA